MVKSIAIVIGNRPHFVKLSVLWPSLIRQYDCTLVHTGQHYSPNLSDIFFEQLHLPRPDYNLNVIETKHHLQIGNMIARLGDVYEIIAPRIILVIGDTNTSLAAAIAGKSLGFEVAHIEAGARSFSNQEIEEYNRKMIDSITDLYLCPNSQAASNLRKENILSKDVYVVGDLLEEAVGKYLQQAKHQSRIISDLSLQKGDFLLLTTHKRPNINNHARLKRLVDTLHRIPIKTIWPMHPGTKKGLVEAELYEFVLSSKNIKVLDPVDYYSMLLLESNSTAILTDSSGVQREACYLKKPLVILNEYTEHQHMLKSANHLAVSLDNDDVSVTIEHYISKHRKKHFPDADIDNFEDTLDMGVSSKIIFALQQYISEQGSR